VPISWLPSTLSSRARSTFRILPRSGRIAWVSRSRADLAEPPKRQAGVKVADVNELVSKLKNEAGVL